MTGFFTWGWTNNQPKNVPAFIFKNAGENEIKNSKDGGLLLIELPPLHRSGLANINAQNSDFSRYQEEQFQFVSALPETIQKKLTVRLHAEWRKHRWSDETRWNDRYPLDLLRIGFSLYPTNDFKKPPCCFIPTTRLGFLKPCHLIFRPCVFGMMVCIIYWIMLGPFMNF